MLNHCSVVCERSVLVPSGLSEVRYVLYDPVLLARAGDWTELTASLLHGAMDYTMWCSPLE